MIAKDRKILQKFENQIIDVKEYIQLKEPKKKIIESIWARKHREHDKLKT